MRTYARIEQGVVVELLQAEQLPEFHPLLNWRDVSTVPGIAEGWRETGESFVAPVPSISPEAALAMTRATARAQINYWRDTQERAAIVFDHAGHRWDASLQVRDRLNATLGSLNAYGLPAGFFWTDADNIDVPMTQLELQALAEAHERAIFARGWQIHARQRELKRQVDAANAEELASFRPDWPGTAAA
ncbi:DUF4376 domain-containing protein [Chitinolyticbacter meiyuanensis]|uniref:DUF4376 domain-containing protein n=1 Tax=Chitinolyticbacter meiyuanensis TaxID=682798 RepID=UPI0011E598DC|nr:DUF4376 domain-containing protein [Chitinolyticbacter meiyuanensis]